MNPLRALLIAVLAVVSIGYAAKNANAADGRVGVAGATMAVLFAWVAIMVATS